MTSTSKCHILELPVELLQLIAEASPDFSTLRLVSKDFEAAVFDAWADKWLSSLNCFLLDPVRLKKLSSITSQKHLARRIKTVRFCLDPWELAHDSQIHMAIPYFVQDTYGLDWGYSVADEQERILDVHQLEQYDLHYQPPDQVLLTLVVENLAPSCSVILDFRVRCSQNDETYLERNREKILSAIFGGVPFPNVRQLIVFNSECRSELFLGALQYMAPTIEAIDLDGLALWDKDEEDVPSDDSHWAAVFRLMLECPKLEYLDLEDICEDPDRSVKLADFGDVLNQRMVQLHGRMEIQRFLEAKHRECSTLFT